jgi:hypothetical protein
MTADAGRTCAWCERPAVCEVEVQPAEYQTVSHVDAVSGDQITGRRLLRLAIIAAVCDAHRDITIGQPRPVVRPRHGSARGPQLDLFASAERERLRNAIIGGRGR